MVNGGMMSRRVRPPVPHSPGGHLSFEGSPEHDSLSKHAEAEEVTSRAQAQPGRSVKVFARLRRELPTDKARTDGAVVLEKVDGNRIRVKLPAGEPQHFTFDGVLQDCSQAELFQASCSDLVSDLLAGNDCCVVSYGHDGGGKTYTATGKVQGGLAEDAGLVQRLAGQIFHQLEARGLQSAVTAHCQYVEVLGEHVSDLLEGHPAAAAPRPRGRGARGPGGRAVSSAGGALDLLRWGASRRRARPGAADGVSHRGTAVFSLVLERKGAGGVGAPALSCRVDVVDVAGSAAGAAAAKPGAPASAEERANASSLHHLGVALGAAAAGTTHVPTRSSALTRALQGTVGRRGAKLVLIAALSRAPRPPSPKPPRRGDVYIDGTSPEAAEGALGALDFAGLARRAASPAAAPAGKRVPAAPPGLAPPAAAPSGKESTIPTPAGEAEAHSGGKRPPPGLPPREAAGTWAPGPPRPAAADSAAASPRLPTPGKASPAVGEALGGPAAQQRIHSLIGDLKSAREAIDRKQRRVDALERQLSDAHAQGERARAAECAAQQEAAEVLGSARSLQAQLQEGEKQRAALMGDLHQKEMQVVASDAVGEQLKRRLRRLEASEHEASQLVMSASKRAESAEARAAAAEEAAGATAEARKEAEALREEVLGLHKALAAAGAVADERGAREKAAVADISSLVEQCEGHQARVAELEAALETSRGLEERHALELAELGTYMSSEVEKEKARAAAAERELVKLRGAQPAAAAPAAAAAAAPVAVVENLARRLEAAAAAPAGAKAAAAAARGPGGKGVAGALLKELEKLKIHEIKRQAEEERLRQRLTAAREELEARNREAALLHQRLAQAGRQRESELGALRAQHAQHAPAGESPGRDAAGVMTGLLNEARRETAERERQRDAASAARDAALVEIDGLRAQLAAAALEAAASGERLAAKSASCDAAISEAEALRKQLASPAGAAPRAEAAVSRADQDGGMAELTRAKDSAGALGVAARGLVGALEKVQRPEPAAPRSPLAEGGESDGPACCRAAREELADAHATQEALLGLRDRLHGRVLALEDVVSEREELMGRYALLLDEAERMQERALAAEAKAAGHEEARGTVGDLLEGYAQLQGEVARLAAVVEERDVLREEVAAMEEKAAALAARAAGLETAAAASEAAAAAAAAAGGGGGEELRALRAFAAAQQAAAQERQTRCERLKELVRNLHVAADAQAARAAALESELGEARAALAAAAAASAAAAGAEAAPTSPISPDSVLRARPEGAVGADPGPSPLSSFLSQLRAAADSVGVPEESLPGMQKSLAPDPSSRAAAAAEAAEPEVGADMREGAGALIQTSRGMGGVGSDARLLQERCSAMEAEIASLVSRNALLEKHAAALAPRPLGALPPKEAAALRARAAAAEGEAEELGRALREAQAAAEELRASRSPSKHEALEAELREVRQQRAEMEAELRGRAAGEAMITAARQERDAAVLGREEAVELARSAEARAHSLEGEVTSVRAALVSAQDIAEEAAGRARGLEGEVEALQTSLREAEAAVAGLQRDLADAQGRATAEIARQRADGLESELAKVRSVLSEARGRAAELDAARGQIAAGAAELDAARAGLARASTDRDAARAALAEERGRVAALEAGLADAKAALEDVCAQAEAVREEQGKAAAERAELGEGLQRAEAERARLAAALEASAADLAAERARAAEASGLESRLAGEQEWSATLREQLDALSPLQREVASLQEAAAAGPSPGRVATLESKVASEQEWSATLREQLGALSPLEREVLSKSAALRELQGKVAEGDAARRALESDLAAAREAAAAAEGAYQGAVAVVGALEGEVKSLRADLEAKPAGGEGEAANLREALAAAEAEARGLERELADQSESWAGEVDRLQQKLEDKEDEVARLAAALSHVGAEAEAARAEAEAEALRAEVLESGLLDVGRREEEAWEQVRLLSPGATPRR